MTFDYEHEMVAPAMVWLQGKGLRVKREVQTPWGICDLVGCSLNKTNVQKRLKSGQSDHISSQLRVAIYHALPDVGQGKPYSLGILSRRLGGLLDEGYLEDELERLIDGKFVHKTDDGMYQRFNGWIPLHKRIVALELKLNRFTEVLQQAVSNLGFAQESYVGLPMNKARQLTSSGRCQEFKDNGIGIVGIATNDCRVLQRATFDKDKPDAVLSAYYAERFWGLASKGSSA